MHRAMKIFHVRVVNPTFLKCKTGANLKPTSATNHPGGHKFAQSAPSTTNPSRVDTIGLENRNKGVGQIPNAESKVHTIEKLGEKTSHNPDKKQAPASAAKQGPAPPMKQTPAPPVKQTPAPPMKLTPAPPDETDPGST
nr:hypothetical protein CFP56_76690 [Quercus suber]